jgi:hypothetical protein
MILFLLKFSLSIFLSAGILKAISGDINSYDRMMEEAYK